MNDNVKDFLHLTQPKPWFAQSRGVDDDIKRGKRFAKHTNPHNTDMARLCGSGAKRKGAFRNVVKRASARHINAKLLEWMKTYRDTVAPLLPSTVAVPLRAALRTIEFAPWVRPNGVYWPDAHIIGGRVRKAVWCRRISTAHATRECVECKIVTCKPTPDRVEDVNEGASYPS